MPHIETKLESKNIFQGRVIHVTLDTVRLEDGHTSLREVVHHHGGACVRQHLHGAPVPLCLE